MSISYTVRVGAYFECRTTKVKYITTIDSCSNAKCKAHGEPDYKHKFCPECGKKICKLIAKTLVDKVASSDVYQALEDRLIDISTYEGDLEEGSDVTHVYVSTRRLGFAEEFDPIRCGNFVKETTALDVDTQKEALVSEHSDDYEYLKSVYGSKNVEVKWGIVFTAG